MKFKVYDDPATIGWVIVAFSDDGRSYYTIEKGKFVEHDYKMGVVQIEPFMVIGDIQSLAQAIESAGIKPKGGSFNQGKIEAMENHLKDMRRIVFKKE